MTDTSPHGSAPQSVRVRPFTVDVPQSELNDLGERLRRSRLFDSDLDWPAGTPTRYLRELVSYWERDFDWRATEQRLNGLPQFKADVSTGGGDFELHFVHARGAGPDPLPLVFSHGWPGSFWEVHKILGPLTDPAAHGGDPADAFHVVAPSLPGFGFSPHPGRPGVGPAAVAEAFHTLMTRTLGYSRYVAQGGDWGAFVTTELARAFGGGDQGPVAIHLNLFPGAAVGSVDMPKDDADYLRRRDAWQAGESAYAFLQMTKPLSIGHALADSPAGLASWIVEKFRAWSDCSGDVESVFSKDELLTHIMLYWLNGTISTSVRLYHESAGAGASQPDDRPISTPTGVAALPEEVVMAPREVVARSFNLQRYTEFQHGGHFAALEQPTELVEDLRAFFRPYRRGAAR
ncbi:epoxide hydrolase family protein [Streptomyces fuscichromogenes]|uniref:epoxide hydrolase family protein n=1 Tax=Streptomyces fuscichromogenes TaxID=1324013 RepID=UPI00381FFF65